MIRLAIDQHSNREEIVDFCLVCHEFKIERVVLDKPTIKQVRKVGYYAKGGLFFMGVNFKQQK